MKKGNIKTNRNLLSLNTIENARNGDCIAIQTVIDHYSWLIEKLATRKYINEVGMVYYAVDDDIQSRLIGKLVKAILDFKL